MTFLMGLNRWYSTPTSDAKAIHKLDTLIDNIDTLRNELSAWESEKLNERKKVNWQFTTKDARVKLMSLYPKFE